MTNASTKLFNYIEKFLEKNACEESVEIWKSKKQEFTKLFKNLQDNKEKEKKNKPKGKGTGKRSNYILFCMQERPKINNEFPDMKNTDIVKLMAERWAEAKKDEKVMEHFKKLAEEDKERAEKEKEEEKDEKDEKEEEKNEKKNKKKTKTGYLLFCDHERPIVKENGFTGKDIMKELGKRWKELPEKDEDRYTEYMEKAAELKKTNVEDSEEDSEEEKKPKAEKKQVKKKQAKKKPVKKTVIEEDDEEEE